jgi:hypothetical protein
VRAAARHDGEARQVTEEAVVADVGGAPRDLAGLRVGEEGGDDELAFGEGSDGAEVDGRRSLTDERRQEGKPRCRQCDAKADDAAESERRLLEQPAARIALLARRSLAYGGRRSGFETWRPLGAPHPGESRGEGDRAAE